MGNTAQTEKKTEVTAPETPTRTQRNFILKVMDKTGNDIKKALKEQGVEIISIMEIHREEIQAS